MARASTPTLLSLDSYSQYLGVAPMHFNGATSDVVFPVGTPCSDVWWQHNWQRHDRVSREDLAQEIRQAEDEIKRELGWWVAPRWDTEEVRQFPRYYRRDLYRVGGTDVRGQRVGIKAACGKIISPGVRAVTLLGTPTVVYSDADGDGFDETATVTQATTLTNEQEVKVYFAGESGEPEWEIRPARTRAISGGNFVATFWTWQLISPAVWEEFPPVGDELAVINLGSTPPANVVTTVDVYREFNDTTAVSSQFYWEPQPRNLILVGTCCSSCGGQGCVACELTTQDGCLHVRDANRGIVVPTPATYDSDDAQWEQDAFTVCRDPDFVKLWYRSGDISDRYLRGQDDQPMDRYWQRIVARLATARIERTFCGCTNVTNLVEWLRQDLAVVGETSHQLNPTDLDNPFGTRRGEIEAWRAVNKQRDRLIGPVALI